MKKSKLHKIISFLISSIGLGILLVSNTFAAGETDFPKNYYDTVALILLFVIIVTLLTIVY